VDGSSQQLSYVHPPLSAGVVPDALGLPCQPASSQQAQVLTMVMASKGSMSAVVVVQQPTCKHVYDVPCCILTMRCFELPLVRLII
jgi:hypothetical protein